MRMKTTDSENSDRVLVILQCDSAHWIRLESDIVCEYVVEKIAQTDTPINLGIAFFGSSDTAQPDPIQLILDTTLDEVDRVSVEQSAYRLENRYRRAITIRNLRRDFPGSHPYALPEAYGDQVAAIMHPEIPEHWSQWLLAQQNAGRVFSQVATGTETMARWSRSFQTRVLVTMDVGNRQRHALIDDGAVVYLRNATVNSEPEIAASSVVANHTERLAQTIEYLHGTLGVKEQDLRVVSLGRCNKYSVSESPNELPITIENSIRCLLDIALDRPITYSDFQPEHNIIRADAHGGFPMELTRQLSGVVNRLARYDNSQCLSKSVAKELEALHPSTEYLRQARRRACIAFLSVCLACGASVFAFSVFGKATVNRHQIREVKTRTLHTEQQLERVLASAAGLTEDSISTADSLLLADSLSVLNVVSPQWLLEGVATAITHVPGVTLGQMTWLSTGDDERFETLDQAMSMLSRHALILDNNRPASVRIQLSGELDAIDLAEQKRLLDTFVIQLEMLHHDVLVKVVESPLDAALSSLSEIDNKPRYTVLITLGSFS